MSKWNSNNIDNRFAGSTKTKSYGGAVEEAYYDDNYGGGGYTDATTRQKADHHLRPNPRSSPATTTTAGINAGGEQYRAPSHDHLGRPVQASSSRSSPHQDYPHGDDDRAHHHHGGASPTLRGDDGVFVAPGRHHSLGGGSAVGPSPPKHSNTNHHHQQHPPYHSNAATPSNTLHPPPRGGDGALSGSSAAAILSALQELKDEVRELRGLKAEVIDLRGEVRELKSEIRGMRSELQTRDGSAPRHHGGGGDANTTISNPPYGNTNNNNIGGVGGTININKQQYVASDCNIRSCELCGIKFQYKVACQHFSGRRHQDCLRELRHSKDPSYADWIIHMKEEYGFDQNAHVATESQSSSTPQQHHAPQHAPQHNNVNHMGGSVYIEGRSGSGPSYHHNGAGDMGTATTHHINSNNLYQRHGSRPATTGGISGGIDTHPPIQNNFRRLY